MPTKSPRSQTSTTDEEATTTSDLPGFKSPPRPPADEALDPDTTTVTAPPSPPEPEMSEDGSWAGSPTGDLLREMGSSADYEDVELDEPTPITTSKAAGRSRVFTTDPRVFEGPIAGLVQLASLGVAMSRKAPPPLWLADEEDVENITAPLARIAARHAPISGGEANDLADGLEAALATTGYVVKNIRRQAEEQAAAAGPQVPPPAPPPHAGP